MKHIYLLFITAVVLMFSANPLSAQNRLVLHISDSVVTLNHVDSVYYSHDSNGVLMQHVVTMDSLYTFVVDDVDSMHYLGPTMPIHGVVRGGIPDSMLVMTMVDVAPISDTAFDFKAWRGDHRQLVVVTNLDTIPFMLYRGHLNSSETIVIDTMSTVMALLSWVMPFDSIINSDYEQFCSIVEQCVSFPLLYSLVAQSIANNRPLDDSLNDPMYEALGMVFAQINQQITPPVPMEYTYEQGNNVMLVETTGSLVRMRMRNLNPSYWGQVKNENGLVLRNIRVASRENYTIRNFLQYALIDFYLAGADWTDYTSGEYTVFNLHAYEGEPISFELTCRNPLAIADFAMQTFILPILSFAGMNVDLGSCIGNTLFNILYGGELNAISAVMSPNFLSLNQDERVESVHDAIDFSGALIQNSLEFLDCQVDKFDLKYTFAKMAKAYFKAVSAAEEVLNIVFRCAAHATAPDSISFCMEWYNNVSENAHYCTTPDLSCISGNAQHGQPESTLPLPIKIKVNVVGEGKRYARPVDLHLKVLEGGGQLSDTLFHVTTTPEYYPEVVCQFNWTLGSDSTLPQHVLAWTTDPISGNQVGNTVTIVAYFQSEERIDSFRVKVDRYVAFSKGNLQYQPSSGTWRFAEHQYDMIGMDNLNLTDGDNNYPGWIDLFSWATRDNPTYVPTNNTYYNNGATTFLDWGDHQISNGGETGGIWRTPEFSEWVYLLNTRPNASNLRAFASIEGMNGLIVLPDNWNMPNSVTFTPTINDYITNVYDSASWVIMENAGAIFLPAAGFRCRTSGSLNSFTVTQVGNAGAYWSSWSYPYYASGSYVEQRYAYRMSFFGNGSTHIYPYQGVECYWGQSVRLIRTL